ncbi:uncharacterized protein LOC122638923 [Telopea speciosissima]|uniref:uncharacterized protein LOC122638923 n=1 Tax=Telopea speciosissima TaxID=54955 RepID=UPI001CC74518|nr:uncharacterized protein LOC122638923 [Telopea speciosissima]
MERFKKLQLPAFSKLNSEAMQSERWISALEKAFDVLECMDAQKLICVGYQLENETEAWWKATKPNLEAVHPNPTWEQDKKEAELSALVQGSKTMLDYKQQFEDLFHFALEHMKEEANKIKKFEKGLKLEIGSILSVLDIQDYTQMVDKAKTMEDRLKEEATALPSSGKRPNNYQNFGWPNKAFRGASSSPNPTQYRRQDVGQTPFYSTYSRPAQPTTS